MKIRPFPQCETAVFFWQKTPLVVAVLSCQPNMLWIQKLPGFQIPPGVNGLVSHCQSAEGTNVFLPAQAEEFGRRSHIGVRKALHIAGHVGKGTGERSRPLQNSRTAPFDD